MVHNKTAKIDLFILINGVIFIAALFFLLYSFWMNGLWKIIAEVVTGIILILCTEYFIKRGIINTHDKENEQ